MPIKDFLLLLCAVILMIAAVALFLIQRRALRLELELENQRTRATIKQSQRELLIDRINSISRQIANHEARERFLENGLQEERQFFQERTLDRDIFAEVSREYPGLEIPSAPEPTVITFVDSDAAFLDASLNSHEVK